VLGTVTDKTTGVALAGVSVRARRSDPQPGVQATDRTDASGTYRLSELSPGRYAVHFRRRGYRPHRQEVELTAGETVALDVQLQRR
jgi:hypothetical protein